MRKYLMYVLVAMCAMLCLPAQAMAAQYYIAAGGESMNSMAEQYAVDPELLAAINNYTPDEPVVAGDLLLLPEQTALKLTVESGDTLYSLAQEYNSDVAELCEFNHISNASRIYPGQTLLLPIEEEVSAYLTADASMETVLMPVFASRGGSGYIWPVEGEITSLFGLRSRGDHSGLDLAADSGTPIVAAANGYVSESDWKNDAYGYAVMLDHGDGFQTVYGHCSQLLVKAGDVVRQGDAIALIGSTGNSTGPHLHFEIRIGGVCVDPLDYLR
jgi:murein DD-endopeptidase MepM/ murein hydrolase activator NlpD